MTVSGAYDLTANGSDWTIESDDGADTLTGIEIVTNGTSRTLLVGSGGFATIQDAVDAAQDGDTILIAAGTYREQVLVQNKDLTIQALDGAVLEMPDQADIVSSGGYNSALTVVGGAVDIVNLEIDGRGQGGPFATQTFAGVAFIDADGSSFVDGHITGFHAPPAQAGNQHGYGIIVRSISGSPDSVQVSGSTIDDFQKNGIDARGAGLTVDIHDNVITGWGATATPAQNGVVILGATGVVDHNTITALGFTGTGTIASGVLVYQSDGVTVTDNVVTMAGTDTHSTAIHLFDPEPGTITGNTVGDAETGFEQTGSFTNPADVDGNTFGDLGVNYSFDPDDGESIAFDAAGTDGDDVLDGGAGSDVLDGGDGDDALAGMDGNDTLVGGGGTDAIDGGDGIDTASVAGTYDLTANGATWTVVSDDGTDTLSGIEIVTNGTSRTLLVGSGGFATIQEAIDAAQDGDTIVVAAGTYDEDLVIDVAVTLLGADAGTAAIGRDGSDGTTASNIIGHATVTAAGDVTIDGFRFVNNATTTGGGPSNPTLEITTGGDDDGHSIVNNVFWSAVNGGANGVDDRAISLPPILDGAVTIDGNLFSGAFEAQFSGASWGRAIWFDGGGVDLSVTGNLVEWSRTGINLDMGGDSTATVSGNSFHGLGTAVSVGVDLDGTTLPTTTTSRWATTSTSAISTG